MVKYSCESHSAQCKDRLNVQRIIDYVLLVKSFGFSAKDLPVAGHTVTMASRIKVINPIRGACQIQLLEHSLCGKPTSKEQNGYIAQQGTKQWTHHTMCFFA